MSCFSVVCGRKQPSGAGDDSSVFSLPPVEHTSVKSFVTCTGERNETDTRFVEIEADGRERMNIFEELITNKKGFKPNGNVESTSLWYLPRTGPGKPLISLGEVDVRGTVQLDLMIELITNVSTRGQWDPELLKSCEVCRKDLDPATWVRIAWTAMKAKPKAAGRDFVFNSFSRKENNERWSIVSWSSDEEMCPPEFLPKVASSEHVRGKLILGGVSVSRCSDGNWRITYMNQVEIGIPSWLSDPILMKNPAILNNLKRLLENS